MPHETTQKAFDDPKTKRTGLDHSTGAGGHGGTSVRGLLSDAGARSAQSGAGELLRTEWLCRLAEPSGANRRDLRLSAGEHVVILGEYRFSWDRGWQIPDSSMLAREPERPFSAGLNDWTTARDTGVYIRHFFIYGVLESTEVAELEITFDAQEGGTDQTVRLTKADWFTTDSGERFFLCALEPEEELYSYACYITAYDANGGELGTFQAAGIPHWE